MKLKIYSAAGKDNSNLDVSSDIFSVKDNPNLLAQVLRIYESNHRRSTAHTKNRGDVSGGGRKPFRQKGTGNARAGSIRSPLWRGGGVTFGPRKSQNYHLRISRKMSNLSLKIALSQKIAEKKLIVVPKIEMPKISTAQIQKFIEKLPIEEGTILILIDKINVNVMLSCENIPYLKVIQPSGLNTKDLLQFDYLLTDVKGIEAIEKLFKVKNANIN
ncbi:MAG: 50S ribosomal protein L4 [Berkelbacteria bacterium GW2011_GWB1_38_5]|uniref:Large ribosomal subunit protein uL4 n=1 Tax=Berkelbacteria bacterium GW2011_GWB1_38_5 TaxID=1618336 RepID=A0A0G0KGL2_9BACT|nr:MAG: 50S ribosomal protein L4 [Berkelbacteria bacterium GW2011_GWB1_38_5]